MRVLTFQCFYCGESQEVVLEEHSSSGGFTVDCDNCCRPMEVNISGGDEGEIDVGPS